MKKGSPRDYDAETGCLERSAQKCLCPGNKCKEDCEPDNRGIFPRDRESKSELGLDRVCPPLRFVSYLYFRVALGERKNLC
jgi:hypothetical protein